jgi:ATP-dependent Lon protease
VERFVVTPELQSEDMIGSDPLPPGQVWCISPGGLDENAGLYRIDVNEGPGSGVKILNQPVPPAFRESIRYGEQNLLARAKDLVGDRDPRHHEFNVQMRAFDASRTGAFLGLPALLALCSALLSKSLRGGLVAVGGLNLGGGVDPLHNAVNVAELAVEKGASTLLVPISARRQLNDLSDEMATKISILYYSDAREALLKSLAD